MRLIARVIRRLLHLVSDGLYTVVNFGTFNLWNVEVGSHVRCSGRVRVTNKGKLVLGDGVTINSGWLGNPLGGQSGTSLIVENGAELCVGKDTGLSNATIIATLSVRIGSNVLIGSGVCIYDSDFHRDRLVRSDVDTGSPPASKAVVIEDDAFLGTGVLILKGVRVGKGAVVGAGSVVRRDVPPNEVWLGNPAMFHRRLKAVAE